MNKTDLKVARSRCLEERANTLCLILLCSELPKERQRDSVDDSRNFALELYWVIADAATSAAASSGSL